MTSRRDPSAVLDREYRGDLTTLRAARQDMVEWLSAQGADEETLERAALIVSELSSNAIQNSPNLPYHLHAIRLSDSHVAISVRNHPTDRLPPPRENWRAARDLSLKELSLRGRGLAIVDSLSEEVTIEHLGADLIVTARLRIETAAA